MNLIILLMQIWDNIIGVFEAPHDRREFIKEVENSLAIIKGVYNIK